MNKDESLQIALEALKEDRAWLETDAPTEIWEKNNKAINAIKESLETKDEPVAWGMETDGLIYDVICPAEHEREEGDYTIPLYTTPQQRKPLTDEQIVDIVREVSQGSAIKREGSTSIRIARAIEAAHGIKE